MELTASWSLHAKSSVGRTTRRAPTGRPGTTWTAEGSSRQSVRVLVGVPVGLARSWRGGAPCSAQARCRRCRPPAGSAAPPPVGHSTHCRRHRNSPSTAEGLIRWGEGERSGGRIRDEEGSHRWCDDTVAGREEVGNGKRLGVGVVVFQ